MNVQQFSDIETFFNSGHTLSFSFRKQQLEKLYTSIKAHEADIMNALYADLKKNAEEAYSTEIGFIYEEINYTLHHLSTWMQPQKVSTPLVLQPSTSEIRRDPLGISFIIAPWNYPFQLCIAPLIGAIAGGNCAIVKPSELAEATAAIVEKILTTTFDSNYIAVVMGDGQHVVPAIINQYNIQHIFFTGSIAVGKIIAQLAATKLIPTTLELGGKSPCIVDETANITVAAKRIVWGKFTNAGQTCVAPDYILVQESVKDALVQALIHTIQQFYTTNPAQSYDYGKIINQKRWQTLVNYLQQGNIIYGGQHQADSLYIAPTLIEINNQEQPIMQEEIFGPILPIISFNTLNNAIEIMNKNPNPLSIYLFSNSKQNKNLFTNTIRFGGGCINNTLMHLGNPNLPFGGVGASGIGQYHGVYSFEAFTRPKAILHTATFIDPSIKYPPYKGKLKWLKMFMK